MTIVLKKVDSPAYDICKQVMLTEETMKERYLKIRKKMTDNSLDALIVYCDLEHGNNFEYLTGFLTRFEEALLVITEKQNYFIAGNENLGKASISLLEMTPILYSQFSLPNQPQNHTLDLDEIFVSVGLEEKRVGIAGWKLLKDGFDLPSFMLEPLRKLNNELINCTSFFISSKDGARISNNANEIAHYNYGASLASRGILQAMNNVEEGMREKDLATLMNSEGAHPSVVTIAAAGKRFENANLYPGEKQIQRGDNLSLTVGYKGGLQSRSCFVADGIEEVSYNNKEYLEKLAIPYYNCIVQWLENIHVGMTGGQLYELVDDVLPRNQYNWKLNPGHLCADEEWLCSPVYKDSEDVLLSGSIIQFDIIPSISPLSGMNCEGGIVLADEKLQKQIEQQYPWLYETFMCRRDYMINTLGIHLHADVLPMGNADGYYRPFLLAKEAFVSKK